MTRKWQIVTVMTELESDYISDYYIILISYVFTSVNTTSSFIGIIKIKQFKVLKVKSKY